MSRISTNENLTRMVIAFDERGGTYFLHEPTLPLDVYFSKNS